MKSAIIFGACLIFIIAANVWLTKHGSPHEVWLYCDQFGWCKP